VDVISQFEAPAPRQRNIGLVTFTLIAVGVPWALWTLFTAAREGSSETLAFNAAAGWFVLLALVFLGLHGLEELGWCAIPALLTIRGVVSFAVLPAWRFAVGDDQVDDLYARAMLLIVLAYVALWSGSLLLMRRSRLHFVPTPGKTSTRVMLAAGVTLLAGLATKYLMWRTGLLSFLAAPGARESAAPAMEWIVFLGNLLPLSMAISAIEIFGRRSKNPLIRAIFVVSTTFTLFFGAISGMKQQLLQPLVLLALIYGITRRRIPRAAFLLPILLVMIYPFYNAYRYNLVVGYRYEANTMSGLKAVLSKTIDDVVFSNERQFNNSQSSFDHSVARLSALNDLHLLLGLPAPSLLNGDEKLWLAPIYPFIPRFVWQDKPVLNKCQRFSIALGRPMTTSTAITPIGDLYSLYGYAGVLIGPFIWGIVLQLFMNRMTRSFLAERGLLIYLLLVVPLINIEPDATTVVAGAVQTGVVAVVLSFLIYGRRSHTPANAASYLTGELQIPTDRPT